MLSKFQQKVMQNYPIIKTCAFDQNVIIETFKAPSKIVELIAQLPYNLEVSMLVFWMPLV